MPRYSIIVPVYNRPDELNELLHSLTIQSYSDFELIVVEDGSTIRSEEVLHAYYDRMPIRYIEVENGGPARARNIGASEAKGEYLIVLDSDVVLPPQYLETVDRAFLSTGAEAFGGPDAASDDFDTIQKSINYAMTSFFTTGGIRGGKGKKLDKFYPRSFNLGCKRELYDELHGFSADMRFGEDIDFSLRLYKSGAKVALFDESYVYHKRRVDFKKFYKQVFNSGMARIHLHRRHPGSLKIVHLLPTLFALEVISLLLLSPFYPWALLPVAIIAVLFFVDALRLNRSLSVAAMAVIASFVQLFAYGFGFIVASWQCYVLGKAKFRAFDDSFYS